MPRIHVFLSDRQYKWLENHTDTLYTRSALIRDLIDSKLLGIDTSSRIPVYRVGAGEKDVIENESTKVQTSISSSSSKKDLSPVSKNIGESFGREYEGTPRKPLFIADPGSEQHQKLEPFWDKILAFWKVKKGSKSHQAFSLQLTELEKILDALGKDVLIEQLDSACLAGTWKQINYRRTVQFTEIDNRKSPKPEPKHPAYKVFKPDDFESSLLSDKGKTTSDLLGGLI